MKRTVKEFLYVSNHDLVVLMKRVQEGLEYGFQPFEQLVVVRPDHPADKVFYIQAMIIYEKEEVLFSSLGATK